MLTFRKRHRRGMTASRPRGLTLIELLISVALSAVVLIALLALYIEGQKQFFNQNSRADTIEQIRTDMARISRDIRDAANVADLPVTAYDGQQYRTGADCVVLETPSLDGSGLIIPGTVDHIIYSYDSVNNQLVRIISPQAGTRQSQRTIQAVNLAIPASGLPPFNLKYFSWDGVELTSAYADADDGAFIIEVELTAQGRSVQRGGKPYVETFRTQAKLRNKVVPSS